jgi:hypothetical protein
MKKKPQGMVVTPYTPEETAARIKKPKIKPLTPEMGQRHKRALRADLAAGDITQEEFDILYAQVVARVKAGAS